MLFNRSTGKPNTDDMLSLDNLIAWLEQRPADGTYDYCSSRKCLLAQYFTAKGLKAFSVTPGIYTTNYGSWTGEENHLLPHGWEHIALGGSTKFNGQLNGVWTYGSALQRAKALKYGRVA